MLVLISLLNRKGYTQLYKTDDYCAVILIPVKNPASQVGYSQVPFSIQNDSMAYVINYRFPFFFLSTIASITATAVMFTISRTEASQSVKWIGLFNPI